MLGRCGLYGLVLLSLLGLVSVSLAAPKPGAEGSDIDSLQKMQLKWLTDQLEKAKTTVAAQAEEKRQLSLELKSTQEKAEGLLSSLRVVISERDDMIERVNISNAGLAEAERKQRVAELENAKFRLFYGEKARGLLR
jgi:hypothetical protein